MKLARRGQRTVYLRRRILRTDDEGNSIHSWGSAVPLQVTMQPAGGSVNAAIYGNDLTYMKSLMYQGKQIIEGINENDGICVMVSKDADDPDYKIISISTYSDHLNVLIKKVDTHAGN
ncbi:hypothetical protein [Levilactobacillus bambusae]|uniref:Head-tail adaptor protein n=1 Tax=Levilactobacillus bambusae TaxID=2024736 RepID=A0A2V1N117_9LACO|nr:hypothetical protein [Levilactobacillus bambusae]PWG00959.1 hypothetical protein DCM90_01925 [Levilactobacillus bambusae]